MPDDVLIVEDDPIIALDFEDTILGFGVKTVRTAGSVAQALEMIAERAPDFALARCRAGPRKELCGRRAAGGAENSVRLRHRLRRRSAFPAFAGKPTLPKPYSTDALRAVLKRRSGDGVSG